MKYKKLIIKIAKEKPHITEPELRKELKKFIGPDNVIDDIDDIEIHFFDKRGKYKSAPKSGLKDRLSRAKKITK